MTSNGIKITTIIQARISSSRLPGKILLPLCGKPLLTRMAERVAASEYSGDIVIATSVNPEDDTVEKLCESENLKCYRGSLSDLLDRHYQIGLKYGSDAVVKIPSDCPLIDAKIIDRVLKYYIDNFDKYDYVSNLHPATYPDGNDVEVMSISALEKAWQEADKNYEREHTTPYFWENPEKFRIANVEWEKGKDFSSLHRWTIDYPEDYEFISRVYDELYTGNPGFGMNDILTLLKLKPEIYEINRKYLGKYWYENHLDQLKHIEEFKNKKALQEENHGK